MHSPYAWMKDAHIDSWDITHLHQWRKKWSIIYEATVKPNSVAVDVGCGTGNIALEMARLGAQVKGIDLCEESIEIANLAKEHAHDSIKGSLDYVIANVYDIEWPDDSLDAITMIATIHHLPHAEEFVAKAHRALRGGGRLLILDHDDAHSRSRWNTRLERIARFLLPTADTPWREKLTMLYRTRDLGRVPSLALWLVLPHHIPLRLRFAWLFGKVMRRVRVGHWKGEVNRVTTEIDSIVQSLQEHKQNKRSSSPTLGASPCDDSTDFCDYFGKVQELFPKTSVQYINAFNAQSIVFDLSFDLPGWVRRSLAWVVCAADDFVCRTGLLKGHEVLVVAEK